MACRSSSVANGNGGLLNRNDAACWRLLLRGCGIFGIALILLAGILSAEAQNVAALTIGGVMPSIQRVSVNSIHASSTTNQTVVTLDTQSNADGRYSVIIQSKALSPRSNGDSIVYEVKCGSRSFTLAPGTARLLSEYADDKSAKTVLQISNPSALGNHTLTLTVISQ
jgi:hypothetical protein